MLEEKDYSGLTLEELLTEQKKVKKQETIFALIIGFLVGVIIYGVARNSSGFIYIAIPVIFIYTIFKNSKRYKRNRKKLQDAIDSKSAM